MENNQQAHFLNLYKPVHDQLTRYCRAVSGNKQDAEDLMNDTILAVFEHLDNIKNDESFKWYLFRTASNLNKMKHRKSKFRAEFDEKEMHLLIDSGNHPEIILEFKMIYEEMLALPSRLAETLILFHISDLSLQEIQKIQGGSLSAVKLRLKRGREKLLSRCCLDRQKTAMILFFI